MPRDKFIIWLQEKKIIFKLLQFVIHKLLELINLALIIVGPYKPFDNLSLKTHRNRIEYILNALSPKSDSKVNFYGSEVDGNYPLPLNIEPTSVISIGIGDNDQWDKGLALRGFKVFQFDHTIKTSAVKTENIFFFEIGISANGLEKKTEKLETIINICKNKCTQLPTILKMDVEGAEWKVLANIDPRILNNFSHIIVEFHYLHKRTNEVFWQDTLSALKNITLNHSAVWAHTNNAWSIIDLAGQPTPPVVEVVFQNDNFVNKTSLESSTTNKIGNYSSWAGREPHALSIFR
jgi:FkbM family methyltransferase